LVVIAKYYVGDQSEEDEMSMACGTVGERREIHVGIGEET
jgi:hypothetical protein